MRQGSGARTHHAALFVGSVRCCIRDRGILVLPLSVPVLIFAAAAMDAASMHLPADGYLAVLGALLAGSATLSPFATAAALRLSVQ